MTRKIEYSFLFQNGDSWNYKFSFDEQNRLISNESADINDWTRLEFCRCPNCTLPADSCKQCPIAGNLDRIVEDSKATISCTRAQVTVAAPERTYVKECATHEGLQALFGLIMAASGCPHLDWLRPLTRFHLPFISIEENLFRILSLQFLSCYFVNPSTSFEEALQKVFAQYAQVEIVNHSFINRIRSYCEADADKNAVAALDVFVQLFAFQAQDSFEDLRQYFEVRK